MTDNGTDTEACGAAALMVLLCVMVFVLCAFITIGIAFGWLYACLLLTVVSGWMLLSAVREYRRMKREVA